MSQRHELETRLKGETLVRKGLMRKHEGIIPLRLIPDLNVIKIGGHGIVDYGREVRLDVRSGMNGFANCRHCRFKMPIAS